MNTLKYAKLSDAELMKRTRKQLGLCQFDMAMRVGYSYLNSISRIETGKKRMSGTARYMVLALLEAAEQQSKQP